MGKYTSSRRSVCTDKHASEAKRCIHSDVGLRLIERLLATQLTGRSSLCPASSACRSVWCQTSHCIGVSYVSDAAVGQWGQCKGHFLLIWSVCGKRISMCVHACVALYAWTQNHSRRKASLLASVLNGSYVLLLGCYNSPYSWDKQDHVLWALTHKVATSTEASGKSGD